MVWTRKYLQNFGILSVCNCWSYCVYIYAGNKTHVLHITLHVMWQKKLGRHGKTNLSISFQYRPKRNVMIQEPRPTNDARSFITTAVAIFCNLALNYKHSYTHLDHTYCYTLPAITGRGIHHVHIKRCHWFYHNNFYKYAQIFYDFFVHNFANEY